MLMGAIIGGVVGLVIFVIQQQQKKKNEANTIDSDVKDESNSES